MSKILYLGFLLCLLLCPTGAEEDAADWMQLNNPGEAHRRLDVLVGTWKTTTKIWMGGPDAAPTMSEGKSTMEWILDGRFLEEKLESQLSFPGPDGSIMKVPFSGRGLLGYDNVRKQYVNTWVDSISTYISYSKGSYAPDSETFTLYGEMDEPALGVYGRMVRIRVVLVSDDRHVFTMYDLHAGEDYKVMEIVYERM